MDFLNRNIINQHAGHAQQFLLQKGLKGFVVKERIMLWENFYSYISVKSC